MKRFIPAVFSEQPLCRSAVLSMACLLACIGQPALATYKCTAEGGIMYSDRPCDGESINMATSSPDHRRHPPTGPDNVLARERAEIARLQKSREQRERQDQQIRDLYTRGAAARARKCSSLALQLRWREEDLREAPLQSEQKARVRARRAAEKYRLECQ